MAHTRLHSNTVSNDCPPETDTASCSNLPRRNSSPTTPLDYKQDELPAHLSLKHFPESRKNPTPSDTQNKASMAKTSSSLSLPTPVAAPEVPYNETARAAVIPKKDAHSINSNGLVNTKTTPVATAATTTANTTDTHTNNSSENEDSNVSSTNHSASSFKQRSRHVSDATEESASEGEHSIATAMRKESISEKRNQEFHSLFRNVPADDYLIEDYGCALQKEILVQGRVYVSENYLCFNANIFGWVTNFVVAFSDIVDIEKRTTAIFIPNAIQVSTLHAKHTFASFLSRDQAFDLIVDVWRYSRPLANRSSDTSINDTSTSQNEDAGQSSGLDDEDTTDIDDSDYTYSGTETEHGDSNPPSPLPTTHLKESLRQRSSSTGTKNSGIDDTNNKTAPVPPPNAINNKSSHPNESAQTVKSAPAAQSTQTKQIKEKTECVCANTGEHYSNIIMDQVYSGSIETIQNLLYTCGFMKEFLADNEKSTDVNMGEWNKSEETNMQTRKSSYVKQLNGSIGPKQTQCLQTEQVIHSDFKESFTMLTTTQTPDVPSGNSFSVKTRTCLTWAGYGRVRILVTATVDFTKSSWIKSTIEKSSIDGQVTYYKHLDAAVRRYMKKHPSEFSVDGTHYKGRKNKGKKHRRKHRKDDYANRKDEKSDDKGNKSTIAQLLDKMTEGLNILFETIGGIFTTPHLTLFCLTTMVCINLYTAWKMKDVEHHLHGAILAGGTNGSGILLPANRRQLYSIDESLEKMYHDELWKWLKSLDTNRPVQGDDNAASSTSDGDFSLGDDMDTNTSSDQQILALAKMVQQAEKNIGQASRVMEKHRRRIEKASPDSSLD
ncbi:unnamed protein product [Absidia cylindrospora]